MAKYYSMPEFEDCLECGKPLIVEGNPYQTQELRRGGVCIDCLDKRLKKLFRRLMLDLIVPPMPVDVRRN